MKRLCRSVACASIVLSLVFLSGSFAQTGAGMSSVTVSASDRLIAEEEFRRGVQAYYRGAFNDALMVFERALSYVPSDSLILDWLGRAYFKAGGESAALNHWNAAVSEGYKADLLRSRIETVLEWRTLRPTDVEGNRYVETGAIQAVQGQNTLFSRPSSLIPLEDGSFWASAYASNEVLRFDVNGMITARVRGPVSGFNRPLDILRLKDGRMLVSEIGADRISALDENGFYVSSFGEKGRGEGALIGPQYIAEDDSGNIYVTDFGNARVSVFSSLFEPLFSFGEKSYEFPGFISPTGIACLEDRVFVADSVPGAIYVFDTSGNYLFCLSPEGSFPGIESIRVWNSSLICSVKNRVILLNPVTGAYSDLANLGQAPVRILSAAPDVNGNIVMADYAGNCIQVASKMGDLASGLFVWIDRVNADSFPNVTIDVRVEDRNRNPVTGLKELNFSLTEDKRPPASFTLAGTGFANDACDIAVLIDRSIDSDSYLTAIRDALSEISSAMVGNSTLTIISAGEVPVLEGEGNPQSAWWEEFAPTAAASDQWRFDLGLRLAANSLVNASPRRAVIFLSAGELSPESFSRYGLDSLASYLKNNGISFYTAALSQGEVPDELSYIANSTGGSALYVYRPEGLTPLVSSLSSTPNGLYTLSFESLMSANFGEAYLPVEVEVYLMNRSGRDETGYFSPLQ